MNTFDVVGVSIKNGEVRIIAEDKTAENARAVLEMAVLRRGVEDEFFARVESSSYVDGDKWIGGAV